MYNTQKKSAHVVKTLKDPKKGVHEQSAFPDKHQKELSTVDPKSYSDRLIKFMKGVMSNT